MTGRLRLFSFAGAVSEAGVVAVVGVEVFGIRFGSVRASTSIDSAGGMTSGSEFVNFG